MAFRERAGRLIRRLLREIDYRRAQDITVVEGIIGTIAGFYTAAYGLNLVEEYTGVYPLYIDPNYVNTGSIFDVIGLIGLIPALMFATTGFFAAREIVMSPSNLRRLAITIRRIFISPDIRDARYVQEISDHIELYLDNDNYIPEYSNTIREILRQGFMRVRDRGINALVELRDLLFTNNDYELIQQIVDNCVLKYSKI